MAGTGSLWRATCVIWYRSEYVFGASRWPPRDQLEKLLVSAGWPEYGFPRLDGFRGEGQPHKQSQQGRVPQATPFDDSQHGPQGCQDEEDDEGLGPVEVAVLDSGDGDGQQARGQKADGAVE